MYEVARRDHLTHSILQNLHKQYRMSQAPQDLQKGASYRS